MGYQNKNSSSAVKIILQMLDILWIIVICDSINDQERITLESPIVLYIIYKLKRLDFSCGQYFIVLASGHAISGSAYFYLHIVQQKMSHDFNQHGKVIIESNEFPNCCLKLMIEYKIITSKLSIRDKSNPSITIFYFI